MEVSPNISQNIHHRILARGSRGHVCGLSMAACRNGGLTRAASIPRVTCVARPSLSLQTTFIVSFGQPYVTQRTVGSDGQGPGCYQILYPVGDRSRARSPRGPIVNFLASSERKGPSSPFAPLIVSYPSFDLIIALKGLLRPF